MEGSSAASPNLLPAKPALDKANNYGHLWLKNVAQYPKAYLAAQVVFAGMLWISYFSFSTVNVICMVGSTIQIALFTLLFFKDQASSDRATNNAAIFVKNAFNLRAEPQEVRQGFVKTGEIWMNLYNGTFPKTKKED